MPIYKALILNKEINVNYEESEKYKLEEAIKSINFKLETYDNQNGKISDNKLLTFLAINLQAELLFLKQNEKKENKLEDKYKEIKNNNILLKDKMHKLLEQNELLKNENYLINQELSKIKNQIDVILKLVKTTYEE